MKMVYVDMRRHCETWSTETSVRSWQGHIVLAPAARGKVTENTKVRKAQVSLGMTQSHILTWQDCGLQFTLNLEGSMALTRNFWKHRINHWKRKQGSSYLSLSVALPQRCRPERNAVIWPRLAVRYGTIFFSSFKLGKNIEPWFRTVSKKFWTVPVRLNIVP